MTGHTDMRDRNPATRELCEFFRFDHLPEHLQEVSKLCAELAGNMVGRLDDGRELTAGLRKLLEAKDCFVRQQILDMK